MSRGHPTATHPFQHRELTWFQAMAPTAQARVESELAAMESDAERWKVLHRWRNRVNRGSPLAGGSLCSSCVLPRIEYQRSRWYRRLAPAEAVIVDHDMTRAAWDMWGRDRIRSYWYSRGVNRTPKSKTDEHARLLMRRYGMTPAQYDALLESQGNACAICQSKRGSSRAPKLFVDHDHATGRVRGLLCSACNSHLLRCGDTLESIMRYVEYLRRADSCTDAHVLPR